MHRHSPFRQHKTKDKHEIDRMTLTMVRPLCTSLFFSSWRSRRKSHQNSHQHQNSWLKPIERLDHIPIPKGHKVFFTLVCARLYVNKQGFNLGSSLFIFFFFVDGSYKAVQRFQTGQQKTLSFAFLKSYFSFKEFEMCDTVSV